MPLFFDSGPHLRQEEFRLIRDLMNDFCGISLSADAIGMVERRLRERLVALDIGSFASYYQHLRYAKDREAEIEQAIDLLTTNETYFFREEYQLSAFASEILPEVHRRKRDIGSTRLSIWSAGCSSGEEVYSLAILLEASGLFEGWDVRVFGNDISRRVLSKARKGVYGKSSFRVMPECYSRFFRRTDEGFEVHPRIRGMCNFGHLNLLDRSRAAIVGRVDIVFCRNVLIYFDNASRRRAIENFYDRLVPGGYLLLGHSESLIHLSTAFELVNLTTDLVYRKPEAVASLRPARGRRDPG